MVLLGKLLLAVLSLALALAVPAVAAPADREQREAAPGLHLTAPPTYAGEPAPVTVVLSDAAGQPVAGASVRAERLAAGEWGEVAVVVTDAAGTAAVEAVLERDPAGNVLRASWDGTTGQPAEPGTEPQETQPRSTGPVTLRCAGAPPARSWPAPTRWSTRRACGWPCAGAPAAGSR